MTALNYHFSETLDATVFFIVFVTPLQTSLKKDDLRENKQRLIILFCPEIPYFAPFDVVIIMFLNPMVWMVDSACRKLI